MEINPYSYRWHILQFEQAKTRARQLQSSADSTLLGTKPSSGKWSTTECVAHLLEFGNTYFENISRGIETAPVDETAAAESFRPGLLWRGVIKLFEPPYKLKLKTINSLKPAASASQDAADVFNAFFTLQDRFIDQLKRCRQKGIHLKKVKVSHPVLPFIKMSLSESYAVTEAHQRRHLWQAEQVLAKLRQE